MTPKEKAKEYYRTTRMVDTMHWTLDMAMSFAEEYHKNEMEALRIHDVVGRSEQFKCHSCGTNHSGKNDDQLYEVCKTCFSGI